MKNKTLVINMTANIIAFAVSICISVFLTPYIVESIGVETYGFVSLGNNFVMYIHAVTIALNSMANRFITIKIHREDYESANKYFSSIFFVNVGLALVLIIPTVLLIIFMEHFIVVPAAILGDVKILWAFLFLNFLIGLTTTVFSVATFATNRLDLSSLREIEGNAIKVIVLLCTYCFLVPKVWYIGFAGMLFTFYTSAVDVYYTRKMLPKIHLSRKNFDFSKITELLASGVWNAINRVGQLLLEGLDLLITNIFIGPVQMGVLALAKTVPSVISSLVATISVVFTPDFTISYAKGETAKLIYSIKQAMKILSVFINIPICVLIVYGDCFFRLWVPTQDASLLQILSIITCCGLVLTGCMQCLFSVFTVTNKVKANSIALIVIGALNTLTVFILLKTTNLGLFAVAGVSTVLVTLKNVFFLMPYAARVLKLRATEFYPVMLRSLAPFGITLCIGLLLRRFVLLPTGWIQLIASGALLGVLGLTLNALVILNKEEKQILINRLLRRE